MESSPSPSPRGVCAPRVVGCVITVCNLQPGFLELFSKTQAKRIPPVLKREPFTAPVVRRHLLLEESISAFQEVVDGKLGALPLAVRRL